MMRLMITVVVTLGLVVLAVSLNPDVRPADASVAVEQPGEVVSEASGAPHHPIWLIESGSNRIYLLGSIHVLRDQDYPLPDAFQDAYDDAEHLVMELDFTDLDPLATFATTRRLAMLPESESLRSTIGDEDYEQVQRAAQAAEIDLAQFSRVDPWYAAMTITQIQLNRLGYKAENGVELYFAAMAKRDDKGGSGLETIDEQLGMLDALPTASQTQFLLEALAETEQLRLEGERMIAAWKSGDSGRLYELFAEDLEENPALHKALLVDRNEAWVPRIIELTGKPDDYLVIVGALHLVGDYGIVELLRKRGMNVRQL